MSWQHFFFGRVWPDDFLAAFGRLLFFDVGLVRPRCLVPKRLAIRSAIQLGSFFVKAILALVFAGMLFFAGCATDVANRYYSDVHYPPRPVAEVELLTAAPSRVYIVLADFQARGETAQDMRRLAAKIGADAVIVTFLGGLYNSGDQWAGHDSQNQTYSRIVATAIKYKP
jgi:hypothetical protein